MRHDGTAPAEQAHDSNGSQPAATARLLEQLVRLRSRHEPSPLETHLAEENKVLRETLEQVKQQQVELRSEIELLLDPEQFSVVITSVERQGRTAVEVAGPGMPRLRVAVHHDVPLERLRVGAPGYLAKNRNCLLHVADERPGWRDVGTFEGYCAGREQVLLRSHEQLVRLTVADDLKAVDLKKGDLVGFDRDATGLAYAKVEPPGHDDLTSAERPSDRFDELGGLNREIALVKKLIDFRTKNAEVADRYRLPKKRGILLEGPPGNGKTKLARCVAHYADCPFMALTGGAEVFSMWFGQTEQKLKRYFDAARELGRCILFIDELDALGKRRGADWGGGPAERILSTFLGLIDGLAQSPGLILIGATNRADVLDPGLLRPGRFDYKLRLANPGRQAARAILRRYLRNGLPLAPRSDDPDRHIEALLSRLYSPKGEYAELARVGLRNGRKLTVAGKSLVSGAMLENVVSSAAETAADREVETGAVGITADDLCLSLDRELRTAAALLTAQNVRSFVAELPQEVEPVAIEVPARGPGLGHYLRGV